MVSVSVMIAKFVSVRTAKTARSGDRFTAQPSAAFVAGVNHTIVVLLISIVNCDHFVHVVRQLFPFICLVRIEPTETHVIQHFSYVSLPFAALLSDLILRITGMTDLGHDQQDDWEPHGPKIIRSARHRIVFSADEVVF